MCFVARLAIGILTKLSILTGFSHFLLNTVLEPLPALLPAVVLQPPVDPVLHHGHELLVAQEAITIIVKYLENCAKDKCKYLKTSLPILPV